MKVQTLVKLDDYIEHLLALDTDSRYLRFGFHAKDSIIESFRTRLSKEPEFHQIFAIYQDGRAIGIGHVSKVGPELAFSVLREYRNLGLGGKLMQACLDWCRSQGYVEGYMVCLPQNEPIRRLARKYGMTLESQDGEVQAKFRLDGPPAI